MKRKRESLASRIKEADLANYAQAVIRDARKLVEERKALSEQLRQTVRFSKLYRCR
jgi:hypothetical protein